MHAWQAGVSGQAFWQLKSFSGQAHAQGKKFPQSVRVHSSSVAHARLEHCPQGMSRSTPGGPSGHVGPENGKLALPPPYVP